MKKGFSLIEVLVVVLIIGILTSIALPQYQKSVEKARATEGLRIIRELQKAQQIFYDTYGRWAKIEDLDALDLTIPYEGTEDYGGGRLITKYFSFTPKGRAANNLAVVHRLPSGTRYYFVSYVDEPEKIICYAPYGTSTLYDKQMCQRFNDTGSL